jgi:hypothetical protein
MEGGTFILLKRTHGLPKSAKQGESRLTRVPKNCRRVRRSARRASRGGEDMQWLVVSRQNFPAGGRLAENSHSVLWIRVLGLQKARSVGISTRCTEGLVLPFITLDIEPPYPAWPQYPMRCRMLSCWANHKSGCQGRSNPSFASRRWWANPIAGDKGRGRYSKLIRY